jgi:hypothetical protein
LGVAILSAAILRRSDFLCCLGVTFFECGDASPLSVVSPDARRATGKRETTKSGEVSHGLEDKGMNERGGPE